MALVQEKKGGPYTKNEKIKRQNEVYRLHFDRGYSAVKISDMMKINRNTVNSDINHGYSLLAKEWDCYDVDSWCMKQVQRLESQRVRLFIELDKVENASVRLSIEKMILDIDMKIMNFVLKYASSMNSIEENGVQWINKWAKTNGINIVLTDRRRMIQASSETTEKIEKLLKEDLVQRRGKKEFPKKK
jgi:hypothetical protein